jgi:hypothetical protein
LSLILKVTTGSEIKQNHFYLFLPQSKMKEKREKINMLDLKKQVQWRQIDPVLPSKRKIFLKLANPTSKLELIYL